MKLAVWTLAAGALLVGPALAQTTFAQIDADGSGEVSYQEVLAVLPNLSETEFAAADTDQSGALSENELIALASTL